VKKRNFIAFFFFTYGSAAFWMVENFWINLYWTRNIDSHVFYVGLMVAASAVVSIFTQIIFGAISDSSKSRFGKRRPFILFGSIAGGISMCFFPLTRFITPIVFAVTYAVIIDCVLTFFGDITNPARAALIIEVTDIKERGKINAILGIIGGLAVAYVVAVSGFLGEFQGPDYVFFMGGITFMVGGVILFFVIKEPPIEPEAIEKTWKENLKETFTLESYQKNKSLYRLLIFQSIIAFAAQISNPYLFIYIESNFGLDGITLFIVLGLLVLLGFIIAIPIGIFVDKSGRKKVMLPCIIGWIIGNMCFIFIPAKNEYTVIFLFLFGAMGYGFGIAAGIATATWFQDLIPEERKGSLSAYQVLATLLPMAPAAILGGFIADYGWKPEGYIYSPLIFLFGGIIALFSLPVLLFIEETLKKK